MKRRILWLSRHNPCSKQLGVLRRMFGEDVEVVVDGKRFDSVEDVIGRYTRGNYDELVLVAPAYVVVELVFRGIFPLKSVLQECSDRVADMWDRNRPCRFLGFERATGLKPTYKRAEWIEHGLSL